MWNRIRRRPLAAFSLVLKRRPHSLVPLYFAVQWLGIIAVVSLYPFSGWTDSGEPLFDFLFYPLPYYNMAFDNAVNILAYMPYGFALALVPRRWGGVCAVVVAGLTSLSMELIQLYLPNRISSNLDLVCNTSGAAIGAFLALNPWVLAFGRWGKRWRDRHFFPGGATDYSLMLIALWFFTQIDPSTPFFGIVTMPRGLPQPFLSPIADPALFLFLVEAGGAMCNLTATLCFVLACSTTIRERLRCVAFFLAVAILLKVGVAGLFLKPMAFFEWINLRVLIGLSVGLAALPVLLRLPRLVLLIGSVAGFAATNYLSSQWPLTATDTLEALDLFRWSYGHLLNMHALAEVSSQVWSWAAIVCGLCGIWQSLFPPRPSRDHWDFAD